MSFVSPFANLQVMLLSDRHHLPWILTEPLMYHYPVSGEVFEVPRHFRTNLVSMPKSLIALPVVGVAAFMEFFGEGVWLGARESVLHDWLRTERDGAYPVPASTAHQIFRYALEEAEYPAHVVDLYHKAVSLFNSD